jgi:aspartate/methionine/tyrosine aminotransferase
MQLSKRIRQISPFHVMDILARAKQLEADGHDVIHLEVGEPDFATPKVVRDAAKKAIDEGKTHYTPAMGLPQLREKIANYYQQRLSADVSAKNIVVTPGASGALQLVLSAVVDAGQKVLMADPGYPCNRHFVRMLDGYAHTVSVSVDTQYQLTHQLIREHWDSETVAVMLASPSNPTGTLISREEMQQIIAVVEELGGVLIVDEIYQGLVYDQKDFTAAEFSSNVFVINSFSKYFSMTGWRLGWLIAPDEYLEVIDRLAQNLFLAAPTISQYAALKALDEDALLVYEQQKNELRTRRDFLVQGMSKLGFSINVRPAGAFYIYADVSKFTNDSFTFCSDLLEQAHVAITPGIDFGEYEAARYVRFAYTQPIEKLQQALDRLGKFLLP